MICAQRPYMWAHPTFIVMFKELVKILPKDGRPAATYGQGHVYFIIKCTLAKGQLIAKRLLEKIIWTKIATKKFDNFCPGGQIKKIKALSYINYGVFNVIKCLYFFDLTTRAEIVKFFRCNFGPNDFFQKAF